MNKKPLIFTSALCALGMMKKISLIITSALCVATLLKAGVMTDPSLVTGANAIDPAGGVDATGIVTGAATKATLTGFGDFGVIQDFVGFTAATGTNVNYIDFSDSTPDIRLTTSSYNGSGGGVSANFATSTGSDQFIGSGGYTADLASVIEFGTYSAGPGFTADKTVQAVGFMFTQNANAIARTWTVRFYDGSDILITTQTSAANANSGLLFGLTDLDGIGKVEIGIAGGGDAGTFMDDLGFATIPEPSSLVLLSLACVLMLGARQLTAKNP